jgi:hypothetical protein
VAAFRTSLASDRFDAGGPWPTVPICRPRFQKFNHFSNEVTAFLIPRIFDLMVEIAKPIKYCPQNFLTIRTAVVAYIAGILFTFTLDENENAFPFPVQFLQRISMPLVNDPH